MAKRRFPAPTGQLEIHGWQDPVMEAAAVLGRTLIEASARPAEPIEFAGQSAFLKGAPLAPRSARRHGLRRLLLRAHPPRIAEYENLCWLHNRLFETPIPLAAGVHYAGGLPRYQFLLTRLEAATPFEEALPEMPGAERMDLLVELGREVARFHSLHFVHRDLYPRNLLVRGNGTQRRIVFLDAWAGGPGPGRRGPAYDLACLFLEGADLFSADEQAAFLGVYFRERSAQASPCSPRALLQAAQAHRQGLRRQLAQEPGRRRGRPMPSEAWRPRWPAEPGPN